MARIRVLQKESTKHKGDVPYKRMFYFPFIARLQRLYASKGIAKGMSWHDDHDKENSVMHHPSDSKAWLHFDQMHPSFSAEYRNVKLELCIDGFQPFGQSC